jgi:2-C-methyl-D-erythritol 4-phosphate cytidylyltransferase
VHAVGIVAAAGSGLRLGADRPKALVPLCGRALVCWSVDTLRAGGVDEVVVTVPASEQPAFAAVLPADVRLVAGGATRTASVRAALAAVSDRASTVLVHDAARPLTPPDVVRRVQTPQGFHRRILVQAYGRLPADAELTDDAAVVHTIGITVSTVAGDERAAKVTVAHDLALAELLLSR